MLLSLVVVVVAIVCIIIISSSSIMMIIIIIIIMITPQVRRSVEAQLAMERVGWAFLRVYAPNCILRPRAAGEEADGFLRDTCGFRVRRAEEAAAATARAPPLRTYICNIYIYIYIYILLFA